ncbi:MAG: hypothetical protein ACFBRM_05650 [Pikeienuella sp.]
MAEERCVDIDGDLAELAAAARRAAPRPSEELVARVLADAAEVAAERPTAAPTAQPVPTGGWALWRRLTGPRLGPGLAALTMVLCLATGVGVGYTGPSAAQVRMAALAMDDPILGLGLGLGLGPAAGPDAQDGPVDF